MKKMRQAAHIELINKASRLSQTTVKDDYLGVEYNAQQKYISWILKLARFDKRIFLSEFVELYNYSKHMVRKISIMVFLIVLLSTEGAEARNETLYGYHCGFYRPCWSSCYSPTWRCRDYRIWNSRLGSRAGQTLVIRQQRREMRQIRRMIKRNYWEKRRWKEDRRQNRYRRLRRR